MLFNDAIQRKNNARPPVWFMRQAGRYHSHYRKLREKHSFIDLCKKPEIACEATMGPIRDFGFDAAILFSDLLFPLEMMGMGLEYAEGPKLGWHLKTTGDLKKLKGGRGLVEGLEFQAEALRLLRSKLPRDKALLGFVGAPLTLFSYAVEGTHAGDLSESKAGLTDGRFAGFNEKLSSLLAANMMLQARAGADAVAIFDTCAGEFAPDLFREIAVPALNEVLREFKSACPDTPVIYYSKKTGPEHWKALASSPIACLGIDWNHDLAETLQTWGKTWAIQGNIDPNWLFLEPAELERRLRQVFEKVKALPAESRRGWVCGLGHGVLPKTPESGVKLFLKLQREIFGGNG